MTKERPILFSAPMVRAILDGRKTQTRRIVKPQPEQLMLSDATGAKRLHWCIDHSDPKKRAAWPFGDAPFWTNCPYGTPGDQLWVREAWTGAWSDTAVHLHYAADGSERMAGEAPTEYVLPKAAAKVPGWVTPLFMPRWASRITLEVTEVRVQRLQEITEEDARAEGASMAYDGPDSFHQGFNHRGGFMELWNSIHGAEAWDANPWVWALTFAECAILSEA